MATEITVNIEYLSRDTVEAAAIQVPDLPVSRLKPYLFGEQAANLVQVIRNDHLHARSPVHLVADERETPSTYKDSHNQVTLSFVGPALEYNPIHNIQEHNRLIETLKNSEADIIILHIGSKVTDDQDRLAFARNFAGYKVVILKIDPHYVDEQLTADKFNLQLDPNTLITQQLLQAINDKASQGKKFVIFDDTSIDFTQFTNHVGVKQRSYGLTLHENLEIVIGRGSKSDGSVPIVLLGEKIFGAATSRDPANKILLHQYPFQPQGPTYEQRAKAFREDWQSQLYVTAKDVLAKDFFVEDASFAPSTQRAASMFFKTRPAAAVDRSQEDQEPDVKPPRPS